MELIQTINNNIAMAPFLLDLPFEHLRELLLTKFLLGLTEDLHLLRSHKYIELIIGQSEIVVVLDQEVHKDDVPQAGIKAVLRDRRLHTDGEGIVGV